MLSSVCREGDVQEKLFQAHVTARGKHANWPCKKSNMQRGALNHRKGLFQAMEEKSHGHALEIEEKLRKMNVQIHRIPSNTNLPQTDVQHEVQAESENQMLERMCWQKGSGSNCRSMRVPWSQSRNSWSSASSIASSVTGAGNSISRQLRHCNTHQRKTLALSCKGWRQRAKGVARSWTVSFLLMIRLSVTESTVQWWIQQQLPH